VEKAEQRIDNLGRVYTKRAFSSHQYISTGVSPPPPSPPSSPPPSITPGQIPGIRLDPSRVTIPEIKEGNAGAVRRRVNVPLRERYITCLGVNSKGNGRYRLLFRGKNIDNVRKDDAWVRTHFDRGTLYGELWYPIRVDRVYHEAAVDEKGCSRFTRCDGLGICRLIRSIVRGLCIWTRRRSIASSQR
jgi:hypothetical protein